MAKGKAKTVKGTTAKDTKAKGEKITSGKLAKAVKTVEPKVGKAGSKKVKTETVEPKVGKADSIKVKTVEPEVVTPKPTIKPVVGPKSNGVTVAESITEIPEAAVSNAIVALRNQIGPDAGLQSVSLHFSLATIPNEPFNKHVIIPVPHAIDSLPDTDVCVIVPDGHKQEYQDKEELIDGVDRIIEASELFREHPDVQSRKQLADSFDLFLCDRRLSPHVGTFLGRVFRDKGKAPVLIDLGRDGSNVGALVDGVDRVRNSVRFQISTGKLIGITLGRSDMTNEELVQNALAALEGVQNFFTNEADEDYLNTVVKVDIKFRDSRSIPLFCHSKLYGQ